MLSNDNCKVVGTFNSNTKVYVILEFDFNEAAENFTMPSIGDFKIEIEQKDDIYEIKLLYNDLEIVTWTIPVGENACIQVGELTIVPDIIKLMKCKICLENSKICIKAEIYVSVPIFGWKHVKDLNLCS